METFQSLLGKKLSEALAQADLPSAGEVTPATDPRFGDYQTNAALVLGKQRCEHPNKVVQNSSYCRCGLHQFHIARRRDRKKSGRALQRRTPRCGKGKIDKKDRN